MIRNTRKFSISEENFADFINNKNGWFLLEGKKVRKNKGSFLLSGKKLRIELSYDQEDKSALIKYEFETNVTDEIEIHYAKKGIENSLIQEMKPNVMYQKKSVLKSVFFFAATMLIAMLSFNFIFQDWALIKEGLSEIFTNANGWTAILFSRLVFSPLLSSLSFIFVYKYVFKKTGDIKFYDLFFAYLIGFFLDQVSPFWGPGLVFVTWFITKRAQDVRLSDMAMVALVWGTLLNVFAMLSTLVLIPIAQHILAGQIDTAGTLGFDFNVLIGLAWGGAAFFSLNVGFYFLLGFSLHFQRFMIWLVVLVMKIIGMSKHTEKVQQEMMFQGRSLKKAFLMASKSFILLPGILVFWGSGLVLGWSYLFSAAKTVDLGTSFTFGDSIAISTLIGSMNSYIPIPGNAGSSEFFYKELLQLTMGSEYLAIKTTVVQRTMVTYAPVFIGALGYFSVGMIIRQGTHNA